MEFSINFLEKCDSSNDDSALDVDDLSSVAGSSIKKATSTGDPDIDKSPSVSISPSVSFGLSDTHVTILVMENYRIFYYPTLQFGPRGECNIDVHIPAHPRISILP